MNLISRFARINFSLLLALLLGGCSTVNYYQQLVVGQYELLQARQPVSQLLADPATPVPLQQRLALAQTARTFASEHLLLPDNRSYRSYADLQRPYVVWNLFATDELSLAAQLSCFPIAGCVAYRGYYQEADAKAAAALLQQQGIDTYVAGVEAYSTLGWFDDPLLSSMLHWDDQRLAALIFHELAHQRLYVADDTPFNESFASFVEQQGLRQWLASRGEAEIDGLGRQQREQFIALVLGSRERLSVLYASDLSAAALRAGKQAEFARLRADYQQLREHEWGGQGRYDGWINTPLNNAKLLPFGLYEQWLPAFAALFKQCAGDWSCFYQRAEQLAVLPPPERNAALLALQTQTLVSVRGFSPRHRAAVETVDLVRRPL
jgi:predicted aminopeptidase